MAKRYIRLNWQNKPSTATPVSAANLNKMDKGIDDLDNAIEEIYAKRVNNTITTNNDTFLAGPVGKNLQDQITTINNNLAVKTINLLPLITVENPDYTVSSAMATIFGKLMSVSIILTKDGAFTSSEPVGITLPVGYRPAKEERQPCMLHTGTTAGWGYTATGLCYVATSGGVFVRDYTSSNSHHAIIKLDFITG